MKTLQGIRMIIHYCLPFTRRMRDILGCTMQKILLAGKAYKRYRYLRIQIRKWDAHR